MFDENTSHETEMSDNKSTPAAITAASKRDREPTGVSPLLQLMKKPRLQSQTKSNLQIALESLDPDAPLPPVH